MRAAAGRRQLALGRRRRVTEEIISLGERQLRRLTSLPSSSPYSGFELMDGWG